MDNPTYNECQGTSTLNNLTINHHSDFENPIHFDAMTETGHNSASKTNSQLQNTLHYEGVYFESTDREETGSPYETVDNGVTVVQGAHINGVSSHVANDGVIMKGAASEGVYELPPNLDGAAADDGNCYSSLNPTYSQSEPHVLATHAGSGQTSPWSSSNCSQRR